MTDLLIRNVDPETVSRIEADAARLGLSREEYLRREVGRLGREVPRQTTVEDLNRFGERFAGLGDETLMRQAWQ
jgi:hypothetical protein